MSEELGAVISDARKYFNGIDLDTVPDEVIEFTKKVLMIMSPDPKLNIQQSTCGQGIDVEWGGSGFSCLFKSKEIKITITDKNTTKYFTHEIPEQKDVEYLIADILLMTSVESHCDDHNENIKHKNLFYDSTEGQILRAKILKSVCNIFQYDEAPESVIIYDHAHCLCKNDETHEIENLLLKELPFKLFSVYTKGFPKDIHEIEYEKKEENAISLCDSKIIIFIGKIYDALNFLKQNNQWNSVNINVVIYLIDNDEDTTHNNYYMLCDISEMIVKETYPHLVKKVLFISHNPNEWEKQYNYLNSFNKNRQSVGFIGSNETSSYYYSITKHASYLCDGGVLLNIQPISNYDLNEETKWGPCAYMLPDPEDLFENNYV